jgi:hypothetical protein
MTGICNSGAAKATIFHWRQVWQTLAVGQSEVNFSRHAFASAIIQTNLRLAQFPNADFTA